MRRLILALAMAVVILVPLPSAASGHCPEITGMAYLDEGFSTNSIGVARVVLDGERVRANFQKNQEVEIDPTTSELTMTWFFPTGYVKVVEHRTTTPTGGPYGRFASTIEVVEGGEGSWEWSGTVNFVLHIYQIRDLSGDLCID